MRRRVKRGFSANRRRLTRVSSLSPIGTPLFPDGACSREKSSIHYGIGCAGERTVDKEIVQRIGYGVSPAARGEEWVVGAQMVRVFAVGQGNPTEKEGGEL